MKRLFAAVAVAGVVWLAPMGAQATEQSTTTTSTSTTTSTIPATTEPPTTTTAPTWTLPEGCVVGEFDVVCDIPTTVPDPTATTTLPPVTTLAPWQIEGLTPTDVCIQHITRGPILQPGEFEYADSFADSTGTTQRLILPCRPLPSPTVSVSAVSPPVLPATGGETGWIALAGLVTFLTGVSVVSAARRSS